MSDKSLTRARERKNPNTGVHRRQGVQSNAPKTPPWPKSSSANVECQTQANDLLSPRDIALIDAVARRVLELLDERSAAPAAGLVDAATLARLLGISRSTVYVMAGELGAVRIGGGSKPRLRFDVEAARAAMSCSVGRRSQAAVASDDGMPAPPADRKRRRLPNGLPPGSVLTIRGAAGRAA